MPDFLSIPGDIRQHYMPFTISGPGKKQVFSFKDVDKKGYPNARQIHPFSQWVKTLILNDSSIKYTHGAKNPNAKVEYDEFLDEIPALQIREYVPDAKLTQTFKWFSYFKKGFDAGLQNIDSKAFSFAGLKEEAEKIMEKIGNTMKDLTSGDAPLLQKVVAGMLDLYIDKGYNIGSDNGFAVLFLPFILYYRLTTTHTNNVYEIPFSMQNEIMKSDGTYGWGAGNQSDFGLVDKALNKVGESPITKLLLGNTVKVNMMPSFQPTGEAKGESFTITIDLINDSDEAAVNNFLMCHTLFGNNRWLQYGFVQAGASLYDVKLPGANRYFMCSGAFSCKGKGAFRTPSGNVCTMIANCVHPSKGDGGRTMADYVSSVRSTLESDKVDSMVTDIGLHGSSATAIQRDSSTLITQTQERLTKQGSTVLASQLGSFYTTPGVRPLYIPPSESGYSITPFQTTQDNALGHIAPEQAEVYRQACINVANAEKEVSKLQTQLEGFKKVRDDLRETESTRPLTEEEQTTLNGAIAKIGEIGGEDGTGTTSGTLAQASSALRAAIDEREGAENPIRLAVQRSSAMPQYKESLNKQGMTVDAGDIKKLIKIPDVYSLTLTFNSLLPDNFNNYLYGFRAGNLDPIEDYAKGNVEERGVFELLVQQLENALKRA